MSRARILADYVSSGDELADKAPLASPAFTGTPTGITAAHLEAGVLPAGVTGGSGLDGGKVGSSAFLATNTGSSWYTGATTGSVISFDDVTGGACFNIGGDYSTTNKRYDVPATGLYWFSFSIYTAMSDAANGFILYVDGTSIKSATGANPIYTFSEQGIEDHTQSYSVILSLTSGQYVDVRPNTPSDWYSGNSFWTGMRIT